MVKHKGLLFACQLPPHVFLSRSLYPGGHSHSYPIFKSLHMCEQPPLFIEHSLTPAGDTQITYDKWGLLVVRLNKMKRFPQKFSHFYGFGTGPIEHKCLQRQEASTVSLSCSLLFQTNAGGSFGLKASGWMNGEPWGYSIWVSASHPIRELLLWAVLPHVRNFHGT